MGDKLFFWAFINFELWAMFIVNLHVYCMIEYTYRFTMEIVHCKRQSHKRLSRRPSRHANLPVIYMALEATNIHILS